MTGLTKLESTKRLLALTKAVKILLYSQLFFTAIYKILEKKSSGFLKNYLLLKGHSGLIKRQSIATHKL